MAVNKVIYNDETLMDLTGDTVTSDTMLEGTTAHNGAGEAISGSIPIQESGDDTIATVNETIVLPKGYYETDSQVSIDQNEQAKILADNIRDGVTILGVEGRLIEGTMNTGTPVGQIVAYMGTFIPEDYLPCNGTIFTVADFPELAEHFEREFGKSNQFGGDGVTTFATPDLRGEFLRGAGTNSHAGQGNGAGIGGHQDGTRIPFITVISENGTAYLKNDGKNNYPLNTDITTNGLGYHSTELKSNRYYVDEDSQSLAFTSRPTNTSVTWIIKAKSTILKSGGSSIISISDNFAFDGSKKTYDLPADDAVRTDVFVNGLCLTEEVDYTVDRTSTPNQITFEEVFDTFDQCTIKCFVNQGGEDV